MIHTETLEVMSEGGFFAANITDDVKRVVKRSGITQGHALVYFRHTTGCILITEHEVGILVDLQDMMERIIPQALEYKHHLRGADANGFAHIRAAMLNVSTTIPVLEGALLLGTWQEILMVDFDEQVKPRRVLVQVQGE